MYVHLEKGRKNATGELSTVGHLLAAQVLAAGMSQVTW
jgi:hypothetical protein